MTTLRMGGLFMVLVCTAALGRICDELSQAMNWYDWPAAAAVTIVVILLGIIGLWALIAPRALWDWWD